MEVVAGKYDVTAINIIRTVKVNNNAVNKSDVIC